MPMAGPRSATVNNSTETCVVRGQVSVDELMMSLVALPHALKSSIKHVQADASSATSELQPRSPISAAWAIASRHATQPYVAAEVLPTLVSLETLDLTLHHLPDGFFACLPPSLETLRLRLPERLGAAELAAVFSRLVNLRSVALPLATPDDVAALQRALPAGCQLVLSE